MTTRLFVASAAALLVLLGCRDDPTGPPGAEAPAASATATAVGSWIARADYPRDVWRATSASITDPATLRTIVYVIGGTPVAFGGAGQITSGVKAYDAAANAWRSKAPYPIPIHSTNGAVQIDGKIYVSGGFSRRWDEAAGVWRSYTVKTLYVYDPVTNAWGRRRDMPQTTARGVSAAYKGFLYVATACYGPAPPCALDDPDQGALWRYNPATDRWVLLTLTPHNPRTGAGGFIGGRFYLVEQFGAMDVYNVATRSWGSGPRLPYRICSPAYTTFQARLYLVGCRGDDDTSGSYPMLVFDPKVGNWSEAAAPPWAADGWSSTLSRVVVNGQPRLELVGGARPGNNFQYVP